MAFLEANQPKAGDEIKSYVTGFTKNPAKGFTNYPATVQDIIQQAVIDLPNNALIKVMVRSSLSSIISGTLKTLTAQGYLVRSRNESRSNSGGSYDLASPIPKAVQPAVATVRKLIAKVSPPVVVEKSESSLEDRLNVRIDRMSKH